MELHAIMAKNWLKSSEIVIVAKNWNFFTLWHPVETIFLDWILWHHKTTIEGTFYVDTLGHPIEAIFLDLLLWCHKAHHSRHILWIYKGNWKWNYVPYWPKFTAIVIFDNIFCFFALGYPVEIIFSGCNVLMS